MSDPGAPARGPRRKHGYDRPLPKRFYKDVAVATASPPARQRAGQPAFHVLLDGRALRTPNKARLALPTRALAEAVAAEWQAQGRHIDPRTMPLTTFANTAIDSVGGREAKVAADIVEYAGSDLICYRAERPPDLAARQSAAWDPILAWASDTLGASFVVAAGIMPIGQPRQALEAIGRALEDLDAFRLAALHVMTTLMGSALLALAHARGHVTAEAAWRLALIDEDFQIGRWGEDAEAKARRARRWAQMQAASRLLALLEIA